jgi:hypothetical protein
VAKKSTTRAASRRKTAKGSKRVSRKKTARRKTTARRTAAPGRELRLANLRRQLERAVKRLERQPEREKTRMTIQSWMADIDDICDPRNPDGCGPIMVFPS